MVKISYPTYEPKIKVEAGKELIFDIIRKRWVILTPEEWVRQNFLHYLLQEMKYPAALIAVEKEIRLGELKKRFDIVVYGNDTKPWMVIECKQMNAPLNTVVLEQSLRYNIVLQVKYIVITNGSHCFVFEQDRGQLKALSALPSSAS